MFGYSADEASCTVGFASPTYSVLESSGSVHMDVLLHRKKRLIYIYYFDNLLISVSAPPKYV